MWTNLNFMCTYIFGPIINGFNLYCNIFEIKLLNICNQLKKIIKTHFFSTDQISKTTPKSCANFRKKTQITTPQAATSSSTFNRKWFTCRQPSPSAYRVSCRLPKQTPPVFHRYKNLVHLYSSSPCLFLAFNAQSPVIGNYRMADCAAFNVSLSCPYDCFQSKLFAHNRHRDLIPVHPAWSSSSR